MEGMCLATTNTQAYQHLHIATSKPEEILEGNYESEFGSVYIHPSIYTNQSLIKAVKSA